MNSSTQPPPVGIPLRPVLLLALLAGPDADSADGWGLVAEYRFDGETRNWADGRYGLSAERIKFAPDRFGNPDRSCAFPDSGFVGSLETGFVATRLQWSWTGWIRPDRIDASNQILYSEDKLGNISDIQLDRDRITVATRSDDVPGNWTVAIATTPVKAALWQHVAVTFDGGQGSPGVCTIYLDGKAVFTGSLPVAKRGSGAPYAPGFAIGSNIGAVAAGQPPQNFWGAIDDVLIFNRALTAGEITATMEPSGRLAAFHAAEIEFFAEQGKRYQLQWSEDLVTWTNEGSVIPGENKPVARLASTRLHPKRVWRYQAVP